MRIKKVIGLLAVGSMLLIGSLGNSGCGGGHQQGLTIPDGRALSLQALIQSQLTTAGFNTTGPISAFTGS